MPELGKTLSQARVARGLTLEDCERDTRVSRRYLDALEREDWKVFPAPVYSRAFLRTYAQYLGLDAAELTRLFRHQADEPRITPLPEIAPPPASGSINYMMAAGVGVFLLIAGAFLYLSTRAGGGGGPSAAAKTTPTVAPEALGGGPAPAVGKPLGQIEKGVVPDLKDARLDDALGALQLAGLSYVVVETATVGGTPGIIASQDPAPGTKAGSKTSVTLVVPKG